MTAFLTAPTLAEVRAHERTQQAGVDLARHVARAGAVTAAQDRSRACRIRASVALQGGTERMSRADLVAALDLAAMELHRLGWTGYPEAAEGAQS